MLSAAVTQHSSAGRPVIFGVGLEFMVSGQVSEDSEFPVLLEPHGKVVEADPVFLESPMITGP